MIDKIKSIAEDVFNSLGSGYAEEVYEKAMEVGLRLAKIPYENQRVLPVFYKNFAVGMSKPDLIVKDDKDGETDAMLGIIDSLRNSSDSGDKND